FSPLTFTSPKPCTASQILRNTSSTSPAPWLNESASIASGAPITTSAGLDIAGLIGGAIITESIFNLAGLGRMTIQAVYEFDLSVVVATTILAAAVVITMNLIVDIAYGYLDPRVRMK
ncbi:MAG: hypothetical protein RIS06_1088, partial [Actinomycetota bacterium]